MIGRPGPMRIAIFDYKIVPSNPIGSCHRRLLEGLCAEHDFTVFAVEFDNPCPDRITWVRVPAPRRPVALLFLAYQLLAPLCYVAYRLRRGPRFDLVQMVESNLWFGDLSYAHFCHRGFLRRGGARANPSAVRGMLRWLDHRLHASLEPWVFRRVKRIVVPSPGLARELQSEYRPAAGKLSVVANPIDLSRMQPPAGFDRQAQRAQLGFDEDDLVVVFSALGHFERKGLPILLDAVEALGDPTLRLLVVGGQPDLVRTYAREVDARGIAEAVRLVGMQADIRPFLWAADLLALPSAYEAWPLVVLEAAAAGMPLLVTRLHGVEDLVRDGHNGLLVDRTTDSVADGLRRFGRLSGEERRAMGAHSRASARPYETGQFTAAWSELYSQIGR
jgi:glycosyltransferase involved in cell wall biosynthesis